MEEALDPYFPFEKALENWGRSFSKLGIEYKGATMTLDLLDRKGKYSNGFCHWPQPAWVKADGSFQVRKKPGFSMGFRWVFCSHEHHSTIFHRRHPSFTSQTCNSHIHALICVQTTPQITHHPPKPSDFFTTGWFQVLTDEWAAAQKGFQHEVGLISATDLSGAALTQALMQQGED